MKIEAGKYYLTVGGEVIGPMVCETDGKAAHIPQDRAAGFIHQFKRYLLHQENPDDRGQLRA